MTEQISLYPAYPVRCYPLNKWGPQPLQEHHSGILVGIAHLSIFLASAVIHPFVCQPTSRTSVSDTPASVLCNEWRGGYSFTGGLNSPRRAYGEGSLVQSWGDTKDTTHEELQRPEKLFRPVLNIATVSIVDIKNYYLAQCLREARAWPQQNQLPLLAPHQPRVGGTKMINKTWVWRYGSVDGEIFQ